MTPYPSLQAQVTPYALSNYSRTEDIFSSTNILGWLGHGPRLCELETMSDSVHHEDVVLADDIHYCVEITRTNAHVQVSFTWWIRWTVPSVSAVSNQALNFAPRRIWPIVCVEINDLML